jgi:molybdopterin converting factor subunit 1
VLRQSQVTVLYFAVLRDLAGTHQDELDVSDLGADTSLPALLRLLEQRHGALNGRLGSVRVAVDEEFAEMTYNLRGGEVVALIPPVSGG